MSENKLKYDNTYHKVLKYGAVAFLVLILIELLAYVGWFKLIPEFFTKYGIWLLYLNISVVSISMSILYVLLNKTKVPCMTGMMIGSIGGIIAGFSSKSTMSWLQGLMAGIMGGTMGPMISVMIFTDRIMIFMPFYVLLNLILLWGFIKMYHEEAVEGNRELVRKNIDLLTFVSACIIIAALLIVIMVYGPKSPIFA